jgi:hypothetical protein
MKTLLQLMSGIFFLMILSGCQEKVIDRYNVNSPVYMSRHELKNAVKVTQSSEIVHPGKIYFKDNYIFINEPLSGIHVIDNSNPAMPSVIGFIQIPGNIDLAIKENILYADSYVDLIALDISDINNIHEVARLDSIFPYTLPPITEDLPIGLIDYDKGIVVGWETKEVKEVVQEQQNLNFFRSWERIETMNTFYVADASGGSSMSIGIGGSMARFTINNSTLYTVDNSNLKTFDIDDLEKPLLVNNQTIGWDVETIFPYNNKLFFGTQTGMLIYDISGSAIPSYVSSYSHIRSCDPVVVSGNYAYVTLRAGNLCGEATSQLDIIDISNILAPKWKQSYPMQQPYGLGIDGNLLFICDGEAGLKVYNVNNPKDLVSVATFPEINAFDVIPFNNVLMMIGRDGLYQYDYSGTQITLLSHIPIVGE